jgi:predicted amidohydrolase YtcJ
MHIIHNAKIYTQNPQKEFATALAITNDRIVAVGTDDEILNSFSNFTLNLKSGSVKK